MIEIIIPKPLQVHTDDQKRIEVEGRSVGEALSVLVDRFPGLREAIFKEAGALRPSLHVFLGEREVHNLQGIDTPLAAGDRLILVLPIAGGSG